MRIVIAAALTCATLVGCAASDESTRARQETSAPQVLALIEPNTLVFFDTGSVRLDQEADQALRAAAYDLRCRKGGSIEITGNADRSGSNASNQRLSIRRAEAVRDTLIAYGVNKDLLVVRGAGETDPLVPTADGVRERQNRWVLFHDTAPEICDR